MLKKFFNIFDSDFTVDHDVKRISTMKEMNKNRREGQQRASLSAVRRNAKNVSQCR